MGKPGILYVITELFKGGAEKNLCCLAKALQGEYRLSVVCLYGKGRIAEELGSAGVDVRCIELRRSWHFYRIRRLIKHIREFQPDILHTFLFHANIAGRYAGWRAGVPVVISSVRVAERERGYHLTVDRWTSGLVDVEVCVSEAVRRFTMEEAGIPESKLTVIPNGIDVSEYGTGPSPSGAPVVTFVGRLHTQKGVDILIRAARTILRDNPKTTFNIVGEGPEKKALKDLAAREDVSERIRFTGFVADVGNVLAASHLLVLPSRWEGMPNAVLEAMACARPVVASNVDGCSEVVDDGKTGLLVPPEDPDALADAVLEILRDPERARNMGQAGRSRAETEFTVSKMVNAYKELYERCAGYTRS